MLVEPAKCVAQKKLKTKNNLANTVRPWVYRARMTTGRRNEAPQTSICADYNRPKLTVRLLAFLHDVEMTALQTHLFLMYLKLSPVHPNPA